MCLSQVVVNGSPIQPAGLPFGMQEYVVNRAGLDIVGHSISHHLVESAHLYVPQTDQLAVFDANHVTDCPDE